MTKRKVFSREFKLEAIRLIPGKGRQAGEAGEIDRLREENDILFTVPGERVRGFGI